MAEPSQPTHAIGGRGAAGSTSTAGLGKGDAVSSALDGLRQLLTEVGGETLHSPDANEVQHDQQRHHRHRRRIHHQYSHHQHQSGHGAASASTLASSRHHKLFEHSASGEGTNAELSDAVHRMRRRQRLQSATSQRTCVCVAAVVHHIMLPAIY